ncbi:hypothetical protein PVAP13_4KG302005 [Panicum virgatum]|uniref:Uncharacterized protein n=1 Tax=Panicum virgatum TaxID=38727 RepID=A0A8T0TR22_PANVG|nr:hypothetical protein PVAP13_4KG302005 [Panicum virgatum]
MGTTLGSGSDLDQDKALACRTLGTSPHHAWRTTWEHPSLSHLACTPYYRHPWCKTVQCSRTPICWTYGPTAGTRINPCVTVSPLASTIWDEEHAKSSLVGSRPPGQDTDRLRASPSGRRTRRGRRAAHAPPVRARASQPEMRGGGGGGVGDPRPVRAASRRGRRELDEGGTREGEGQLGTAEGRGREGAELLRQWRRGGARQPKAAAELLGFAGAGLTAQPRCGRSASSRQGPLAPPRALRSAQPRRRATDPAAGSPRVRREGREKKRREGRGRHGLRASATAPPTRRAPGGGCREIQGLLIGDAARAQPPPRTGFPDESRRDLAPPRADVHGAPGAGRAPPGARGHGACRDEEARRPPLLRAPPLTEEDGWGGRRPMPHRRRNHGEVAGGAEVQMRWGEERENGRRRKRMERVKRKR